MSDEKKKNQKTTEEQDIDQVALEQEEIQEKKGEASSPEEELHRLKEDNAELKDKYLRLFAEFDNYKKRNLIITEAKARALRIIDDFTTEGKDFTLAQFEERFRGRPTAQRASLKDFWRERVSDLERSGKTGNAQVYEETMHSFFNFTGDSDIKFADITPGLLGKYEVHLRERNGTDGGISVRMRTIRALYNLAIRNRLASREHYPFDEYKISQLKPQSRKIALTREEVRKIEALDIEQFPHLADAKHFFVFSYYTHGMNFIDVMKLKWANITNGKIHYRRSKTGAWQLTAILPPVQDILDYYKIHYPETSFVFPFMGKENLTRKQVLYRKKKMLKQINRELKEIAKALGIQSNLSSYVTRHSFATNLKFAGVSTEIISESLGHSNVKITETYLKSFENNIIDEAVKKLL